MKAVQERVSYADLERWPEDGRRYELYNGEVFEIPSPTLLHQIALGRVYLALSSHVQAHGGLVVVAPLDVVLTEFDVVQPDVLLFTAERVPLLDLRTVAYHPPDLAVEILSPGTSRNDRGRKLRLFERHRVQEYWLVDPNEPSVEVYRLSGARLVLASTARRTERIESTLLPELDLRPSGLVPVSAREPGLRTEG